MERTVFQLEEVGLVSPVFDTTADRIRLVVTPPIVLRVDGRFPDI